MNNTLNVKQVRKDFPIFQKIRNLVYLDSTASSLKPKQVVEKLKEYYEGYSSNIFRGLYPISIKATEEYEKTREAVVRFVNAHSREEIIFTRNTSESLNLVAYSLSNEFEPGTEIITTLAEHHSNFVPWQQLALKKGWTVKLWETDQEGRLSLENLDKLITPKTKLLAITYVSNVLGIEYPIKEIVERVKSINANIVVVVDAAQAAPHRRIDVQDLGCDFLAFSSHKMLGPTGVGVLWGKKELLERMSPFLYGGEMIKQVTREETIVAELPHKFEAGTPSIGEVIAFRAAIEYLEKTGLDKIKAHEKVLVELAMRKLKEKFGDEIQFLGPQNPAEKTGILAFTFKQYHPHDMAEILGSEQVCVRAGSHCAMPLHDFYGLKASTRASFYLYNEEKDVEKLVTGLEHVDAILKKGGEFKSQYVNILKAPCC